MRKFRQQSSLRLVLILRTIHLSPPHGESKVYIDSSAQPRRQPFWPCEPFPLTGESTPQLWGSQDILTPPLSRGGNPFGASAISPIRGIYSATLERARKENKPNVSFPRDSSTTLGMTHSFICHVEQAKRRRNISRKLRLRSGTIK